MSNKPLVIGLDGEFFNVLDPLIEKGFLPHIAKLLYGGPRTNLETIFPPFTAVASSFISRTNPN